MMRQVFLAAAAALCFAQAAPAGVVFTLDLDASTSTIESSRVVAPGESFQAALVMTITGTTQVSAYGVSVQFDTDELNFVNFATLTPSGFFELASPTVSDPAPSPDPQFGSTVGQVNTINAGSFGSTLNSSFSAPIATLQFDLATLAIDTSVDLLPGFFAAADGVNDQNNLPIGDVSFVGGTVNAVPEPGSLAILAAAALGGWTVRRRRGSSRSLVA